MTNLTERNLLNFLFILLIISTFLGGVRKEEGIDIIRIIRIISICTVFFAVIILMIFNPVPLVKPYFISPLLIFYLFGLLSVTWSVNKLFALWKLFEVFSLLLLVYRIYLYDHFHEKAFLLVEKFINVLSLVIILVLVSGFFFPEEAFQDLSGSIISIKLHGSLFTMNSNDLGFFSSLLFVLHFNNFLNSRKPQSLYLFILFFIILFLSQSRIFILFSLVFVTYLLFTKKKLVALLVISFIILYLSIHFSENTYLLFQSFLTRGDNAQVLTLHGRLYYWGIGVDAFLSNWFAGLGFYVGHRFLNLSIEGVDFQSSTFDNTWIDISVDLGIIGLVLILYTFLLIFKGMKMYPYEKFKGVLLTSVLFLLTRSFTGPSFETFNLYLIMLLLLIYVLSINKTSKVTPYVPNI